MQDDAAKCEEHNEEEAQQWSKQQETMLLQELLRRSIASDLVMLRQAPSLSLVNERPFVEFIFKCSIVSFPWLQSADSSFWQKVDRFFNLFSTLGLSSSDQRNEQRKLDRLVERLQKIIVLLYKNTLRSSIEPSVAQDKLSAVSIERKRRAANLKATEEQQEHSNDEEQLLTENHWKFSIIGTREEATNNKKFTVYVVESEIATRKGVVTRRYNDFVKLHQDIQAAFKGSTLPSLPAKRLLRSHSTRFIEKRKTDLTAYMSKLLNASLHLRKSDIMQQFLFDGIVELTAAEESTQQHMLDVDKEADKQIEEMFGILNNLVLDSKQEETAADDDTVTMDNLFPTIKRVDKVDDLPQSYQQLRLFIRNIMAHRLYQFFHARIDSAENLDKMKKLYTLIPFAGMAAIMKVANPVKLLRGLLDLFFAKVLGKNLVQRMISESYLQDDMSAQARQKTRDRLGKQMAPAYNKIKNYIMDPKLACPTLQLDSEDNAENATIMREILLCQDVEPKISADFADKVIQDNTKLSDLTLLCLQYIRLNDANLLIDFFGNDEVIQLIKDMISVFYMPLVSLYQLADLASIVGTVKSFWSNILKVAEKGSASAISDPRPLINNYTAAIANAEAEFYTFLHGICVKDTNRMMEELMKYFFSILSLARKRENNNSIQLSSLVASLSNEEAGLLVKELRVLEEYKLRQIDIRNECMLLLTAQGLSVEQQGIGFDGYISEEDIIDINFPDDDRLIGNNVAAVYSEEELTIPNFVVIPKLLPLFAEEVQRRLFTPYNATHPPLPFANEIVLSFLDTIVQLANKIIQATNEKEEQ